MRDSEMFNILSTLDNVKKKTQATLTESINKDSAIKENPESTMRSILQRLDESESVAQPEGPKKNYMPGTHKMANNTGKKHPASEFLVGGEEGETPEGEEKLDEESGPDYKSMYHVLMGSLEEIIDQYSNSPEQQNEFYQNIVALVEEVQSDFGGGNMPGESDPYADEEKNPFDDVPTRPYPNEPGAEKYESVDEEVEETYDPARQQFVKQSADPYKAVSEETVDEESLKAKQSFADVFKSMDESEEEKTARLEKELFTELDTPELTKADNGKYNLRDGQK